MTCNEFMKTVVDLFDKEVDAQVRTECERHMAECSQCRKYYEDLKSVEEWLRPSHQLCHFARRRTMEYSKKRTFQKVAAVFVGLLLMSGFVFALIRPFLTTPKGEDADTLTQVEKSLPFMTDSDGVVSFNIVPLDSILTVVSRHYGKVVQFRNEEARTMRLIMTWQPTDSLGEFIGRLNLFEGLHLTLQADTLIVETEKKEGE